MIADLKIFVVASFLARERRFRLAELDDEISAFPPANRSRDERADLIFVGAVKAFFFVLTNPLNNRLLNRLRNDASEIRERDFLFDDIAELRIARVKRRLLDVDFRLRVGNGIDNRQQNARPNIARAGIDIDFELLPCVHAFFRSIFDRLGNDGNETFPRNAFFFF